jgi:hypothetical protein
MTRLDPVSFIRWLLADVSRRQDAHGNLLRPARRRSKAGKRILIYSRRALEANVSGDYCGIIWQDSKRGRDNDQLWRLALAVTLLQMLGFNKWTACYELPRIAGKSIAPLIKCRTPVKKLANDPQENAERLRVRVSRFITRYKRAGLDLRRDLRFMERTYEYLHCQELGNEHYQEVRAEFISRVAIADECCEWNDWARVESRLALASLAHESGRYDGALHWYKNAYSVLEGMEHSYKDAYLPWIQHQIERCHRKEAMDEGIAASFVRGPLGDALGRCSRRWPRRKNKSCWTGR